MLTYEAWHIFFDFWVGCLCLGKALALIPALKQEGLPIAVNRMGRCQLRHAVTSRLRPYPSRNPNYEVAAVLFQSLCMTHWRSLMTLKLADSHELWIMFFVPHDRVSRTIWRWRTCSEFKKPLCCLLCFNLILIEAIQCSEIPNTSPSWLNWILIPLLVKNHVSFYHFVRLRMLWSQFKWYVL